MYITNITDDYNCTNSENNIEIIIPLITITPCGLSFICLISLMVYTLIKPLFNKKYYINDGGNFISNSSCSLYYNRAK